MRWCRSSSLKAEGVRWAREVLQHSPTAIRCLKAAFNAETDGMAGSAGAWLVNATHLFYRTEEAVKRAVMPFLRNAISGLFRAQPWLTVASTGNARTHPSDRREPLSRFTVAVAAEDSVDWPFQASLPPPLPPARRRPSVPLTRSLQWRMPISLEASLARVPVDLLANGLAVQLPVPDRTHRQLLLLRDGVIRRRYPAAVGTEVLQKHRLANHRVLQKVREPVSGPTRWMGATSVASQESVGHPLDRFLSRLQADATAMGWRCNGSRYRRDAPWRASMALLTAGRWDRAVSHGCVRLYEENVQ